jgi:translation initiation factor IF-3
VARKKTSKFKFYRINQKIRSPKLRVIGPDGKQVGVLALAKALEEAQKRGVDLVEVAPQAKPPVAKLIDFKKFRYLEAKKRKEERKKSKGGELKIIRLSPFIAQGDLNLRIKRAKGFLSEGDKVKIEVRFFGRQLTKKEFGYKILKEFIDRLSQEAKPEQEPKWMGKRLMMTLVPGKGEKDESKKEDKTENKKISQSKVQNNQDRKGPSPVLSKSSSPVKKEKINKKRP